MSEAQTSGYRLAKTLGVLAITASAVAAEYGAGISFVSVQSLSVYPAMHGLVPLAMFITGIAMLPKAYLFAAFSSVMPRAGSKHVWIARSLGMPAGFLITFLYWASGLVLIAVLGSLFLTQAVYAGWAMGVAVRSLAVLAVWLALAIGALHLPRHPPARDSEWAKAIMARKLVVPASIISIVLAVPLIVSLAVVPHTRLWMQPLFQGAVVLAIGAVILAIAHSRAKQRGDSLHAIAAVMPIE